MPISKSALVTTTVHQFQKLGLVLCMVFNQEFEFCVQSFFSSVLKNSIFLHFNTWLTLIMQNWKKLLSFHYCLLTAMTNFSVLSHPNFFTRIKTTVLSSLVTQAYALTHVFFKSLRFFQILPKTISFMIWKSHIW